MFVMGMSQMQVLMYSMKDICIINLLLTKVAGRIQSFDASDVSFTSIQCNAIIKAMFKNPTLLEMTFSEATLLKRSSMLSPDV